MALKKEDLKKCLSLTSSEKECSKLAENRLSCLDESQFSKLFGAPTAGGGVVRVALGLFRLF